MKKGIKILIISLIALLVVGCATFAYLYYLTDVFKTNKDKFYISLAKINASDVLELDFLEGLKNKLENSSSNEKNGKLVINFTNNNENVLDSSAIEFSSKTDNLNDLSDNKVIFTNKNNENLFEVDIVKNLNTYGVIIKDVVNKYVGLKNENLDEFMNKIGIDNAETIMNEMNIENKIPTIEQEVVSQKMTNILNTIREQTNNEDYTKLNKTFVELDEKQEEVNGYRLTLKQNQINSISGQNDEKLIDQINDLIYSITNISQDIEAKFDVLATIYEKDKKVVKLDIVITDNEKEITISQTLLNNRKTIIEIIDLEQENSIIFDIIREGDINSDQISYYANMRFDSEGSKIKGDVSLQFNMLFNSNFTVTEFNSDNIILLNDVEPDRIMAFIQDVQEEIERSTRFDETIIGVFLSEFVANQQELNTEINI